MSTREKLLTKWLRNPPREAPYHEVEGVINWAVRELGFVIRNRQGSHVILYHEQLRQHDEFHEGLGSFDVCTVNGQQVKGYKLQLLAHAIDIVRSGT